MINKMTLLEITDNCKINQAEPISIILIFIKKQQTILFCKNFCS